MKTYKLALVGFGNVGQGFAKVLQQSKDSLAKQGLAYRIVAVSDFKLGSIYHADGFIPAALLEAAAKGNLTGLPASQTGWSVEQMIDESGTDVLVEVSYTDLETGEPATSFIRRALARGMHVATTNKGPIALNYPQLAQLAADNQAAIGFEGTVMSGTPTLGLAQELLAAAGIQRVQGILNGTTNFILTKMEEGGSYPEALAEAQQLGYAEADPTGDVEGHDAAGKVVILANVLMGAALRMADVDLQGITQLTPADIEKARQAGKRWKLIGTVSKDGDKVTASVKPTEMPLAHPLAAVGDATNAVTFTTELLGEVTLVGPGAGRLETGYALLLDLLGIHRRISR